MCFCNCPNALTNNRGHAGLLALERTARVVRSPAAGRAFPCRFSAQGRGQVPQREALSQNTAKHLVEAAAELCDGGRERERRVLDSAGDLTLPPQSCCCWWSWSIRAACVRGRFIIHPPTTRELITIFISQNLKNKKQRPRGAGSVAERRTKMLKDDVCARTCLRWSIAQDFVNYLFLFFGRVCVYVCVCI